MRVALDATVVTRHVKGTGRVAENLLIALGKVDPELECLALAFPEGAEILRRATADYEIVSVPPMSGLRWELLGMGSTAAARGADVVFTLREVVGFAGPPTVMHVAEPPSYRLRTGRKQRTKHAAKDRLLQAMLGGSVRRAASVTAASEATADWLRQRYRVDPPVIPPGIDPFFLEQMPASAPSGRYFLHPATGDQRDNTDLALRAFARARLSDVRLVLVGTSVELREPLEQRARMLGIAERVDLAGWVTDERLRELYRGAVALVHPSKYEGFAGLQTLEAMAQGTPVIALHASGISEALRGAAELLDTEQPEELADTMRRLACDENGRTKLGDIGRQRVRHLTWDAAAARFAEILLRSASL